MKQIITIFCLIVFVLLSSYFVLNEKKFNKNSERKSAEKFVRPSKIKVSPSNELKPFELQKKRIESGSIIEFQNTETRESYKLNEEEMGTLR